MKYKNLQDCIGDLRKLNDLVCVDTYVDPDLEIGAIQRRVFKAGGPAILFTHVKGTSFPMLANLFGTKKRVRHIFGSGLKVIESLMRLKINPFESVKHPFKYLSTFKNLTNAIVKKVSNGPVMQNQTNISSLPHLKSWPQDGGAYITLPQVYTESINRPGWISSNLGMYRIQLNGNQYQENKEVGLHYQIHRGIGYHHAEALKRNQPLKVNVFIGGPPALTLAAIMPLPEGIPELAFAGILGGHRIPLIIRKDSLPIPAEADFCLTGVVDPKRILPEGPFGDHLGYYSLIHDFPVLQIKNVFHRTNAVWPFTTVGRPPQEDSIIGEFIHEITAPMVDTVFCGIKEINAVDAAGVHPLLLAIGSERYVPYAAQRCPQELLTGAMSLLGNTQTSLSKYLLIVAHEDNPQLHVKNTDEFIKHLLERIDLQRDIHFITRTTADTLDYSGISLNQGSKVIMAGAGQPRRKLISKVPADFRLSEGFKNPMLCLPGVICVEGPKHTLPRDTQDTEIEKFCFLLQNQNTDGIPLIVVVDNSEFCSKSSNNFLWVTFTRSDPATDIYGTNATIKCKHWGCTGSIVIDARLKSHHAPPLEENSEIEKRVDNLGKKGNPLYGII